MAGETMQGTATTMSLTVSSVSPVAAWAKVDEDTPQYSRLGLRWYIRYGSSIGALHADTHTVIEHDDGSITVSPSLVLPPARGAPECWHGWLTRGVFSGSFEPVPA